MENTLNFIQDLEVRRYAKYPLQAHDAFPLEVFDPAVPMLEQALQRGGQRAPGPSSPSGSGSSRWGWSTPF